MNLYLRSARSGVFVLGGVLLASCASLDISMERAEIQQQIIGKTGTAFDFSDNSEQEKIAEDVLSMQQAVELSLQHHPEILELLEQLQLGQAEKVQAGLVKNPILELVQLKPRDEAGTILDIGVRFEVLDLLLVEPRRKLAMVQFKNLKLRITEQLLRRVFAVRSAYLAAQAAAREVDIARRNLQAVAAQIEVAGRLYKIKNIPQSLYDRYILKHGYALSALQQAEYANVMAISELQRSMGVVHAIEIDPRIPPIPVEPLNAGVELSQVRQDSLQLQLLRSDQKVLANKLGISNVDSVLSELEFSYAWDREAHGEWSDGPGVELSVPLFDTGKAKRAAAKARLKVASARYKQAEMALDLASRHAVRQLTHARWQVEHYIDVLLPAAQRIKHSDLLHYNAMQSDVFALLDGHQQWLRARQGFWRVLYSYWQARNAVDALVAGINPDQTQVRPSIEMSVPESNEAH